MTESIRCIIDQIWFPCVKCGKEITHHSMHSCFVMNPDILPTLEEWQLVCKMVKQQEKKIIDLAFDLEYAKRTDEFVKKASEK